MTPALGRLLGNAASAAIIEAHKSTSCWQQLVHTFVRSRLDYCNGVRSWSSKLYDSTTLRNDQFRNELDIKHCSLAYSARRHDAATRRVQNIAACLIIRLKPCDHSLYTIQAVKVKVDVKVGFLGLYIAQLTRRTRTARFTISEMAVDWQEPVVLRRYAAYPLPALRDIGPAAAASTHTTAPINHTRPSPRKHSPDGATPSEVGDIQLLLTTHLSISKG